MMANEKFYYVYILFSLKDGKRYTGYTLNLPISITKSKFQIDERL